MAWFKVDDSVWCHPKFLMLSDAAQALWLRAGAWSAQTLTNGVVPKVSMTLLRASDEAVQELVASGLWETAGDGYRFHDWLKYQPSKNDVVAKRDASAARVRKWRESRGSQHGNGVGNGVTNSVGNGVGNGVTNSVGNGVGNGVTNSVGNSVGNGVTNSVGNGVGNGVTNSVGNSVGNASPDPSRPDPTRPDPININNPPKAPQGGESDPDSDDDDSDDGFVEYTEQFDQWWATYPLQQDKKLAFKEFRRALRRTSFPVLLAGAQKYANDPNLPEPRYITRPKNWLRNDGWMNGPLPARASGGYRNRSQERYDVNRQRYLRAKAAEQSGQQQEIHQIGGGANAEAF